ncbi:MAG TPA: outer membrane beta-barrel protein, partial [Hymenobacter sp.]
MLPSRLALAAVLLLVPALSPAQTTDPAPTPAPAPKFYVGLGVSSSEYQQWGNKRNGGGVPVQLTGGYQLRPRLAVQVGLTYSGNSNNYEYVSQLYTNSSVPSSFFADAGRRTFRRVSGSVLGRYTLTRKAAHRVQFDVLGGFGLEHQWGRARG